MIAGIAPYVFGAVLRVVSFLALGFQFGNVPTVKRNFHLVILGIVVVSCIPPFLEWLRVRNEKPPLPLTGPA